MDFSSPKDTKNMTWRDLVTCRTPLGSHIHVNDPFTTEPAMVITDRILLITHILNTKDLFCPLSWMAQPICHYLNRANCIWKSGSTCMQANLITSLIRPLSQKVQSISFKGLKMTVFALFFMFSAPFFVYLDVKHLKAYIIQATILGSRMSWTGVHTAHEILQWVSFLYF